ncbi:cytochrome c551 [Cytobacillus sp. FJAT-53684]|uniref:Cytochrome c551 n=1 Tax=Cytobacillus mangrovibacter TaxID=3299024 RepID=A0ABW6JZM2_9BACI
MKKKLLALLLGSSLVLALAACGGGDDAKETDSGTTGGETTASAGDAEKLFNQKCSSCHGGNLEGGVGPALDKAGATHSKEDIETIIANGQGAMPAGLLSGDEASQVAEWLAAKK